MYVLRKPKQMKKQLPHAIRMPGPTKRRVGKEYPSPPKPLIILQRLFNELVKTRSHIKLHAICAIINNCVLSRGGLLMAHACLRTSVWAWLQSKQRSHICSNGYWIFHLSAGREHTLAQIKVPSLNSEERKTWELPCCCQRFNGTLTWSSGDKAWHLWWPSDRHVGPSATLPFDILPDSQQIFTC